VIFGGTLVISAVLLVVLMRRERIDPLERLAALNAPTADIDQMLAEIEAGRRQSLEEFRER
jgi:hypothetical protein